MFQILTERLRLRAWQECDFETLVAINADPDVMEYIADGGPRNRDQTRESFDRQVASQQKHGYCMWAVELLRPLADGNQPTGVIGLCGLFNFVDGEVETGWRLAKEYWGMGLATEAALAVQRHAFDALQLPRLVAIAHPPNRGSIRIMEKTGMRFEKMLDFDGVEVVYYVVDNPQVRMESG